MNHSELMNAHNTLSRSMVELSEVAERSLIAARECQDAGLDIQAHRFMTTFHSAMSSIANIKKQLETILVALRHCEN